MNGSVLLIGEPADELPVGTQGTEKPETPNNHSWPSLR